MRYFPSICFGLILSEVAIHTLQVLRESRRQCRNFLGTPKSYAIGGRIQWNHIKDDGPIAQVIRVVSAIRVLRSRKNTLWLAEPPESPPERPRLLPPSGPSPTRSLGLPKLEILRLAFHWETSIAEVVHAFRSRIESVSRWGVRGKKLKAWKSVSV